jgi:hypothetical protein
MARQRDPRIKRPNETSLQWRLRVAALDEAEKVKQDGRQVPTIETMVHGEYRADFVTHIESNTNALVVRNAMTSAFARMHSTGQITTEQLDAAGEIAQVAETITRAVSVRGASMDDSRVDNSGAARDLLIERLHTVRLEATYSRWRRLVPKPKEMVIGMILRDSALVARAHRHNVPWRKARAMLLDSLDLWNELKDKVWKEIDAREVQSVYWKVGGGILIDGKGAAE